MAIAESMQGRTRLAVMEDGLREMYTEQAGVKNWWATYTWGAWKTYCRVCRPHL